MRSTGRIRSRLRTKSRLMVAFDRVSLFHHHIRAYGRPTTDQARCLGGSVARPVLGESLFLPSILLSCQTMSDYTLATCCDFPNDPKRNIKPLERFKHSVTTPRICHRLRMAMSLVLCGLLVKRRTRESERPGWMMIESKRLDLLHGSKQSVCRRQHDGTRETERAWTVDRGMLSRFQICE